ncbi:hypothetical protein [Prauserella cavernicola]|uniref:Uncharacterized protein n=1 Tax=Prauserella cavernicola TaxID=2800127 RepID=A0A934V393_9PSEU|nr:hypothetical protein [Prauserella cavernicola]MBK1782740.1 hypothetical protein [Prauserella cavernicola]
MLVGVVPGCGTGAEMPTTDEAISPEDTAKPRVRARVIWSRSPGSGGEQPQPRGTTVDRIDLPGPERDVHPRLPRFDDHRHPHAVLALACPGNSGARMLRSRAPLR